MNTTITNIAERRTYLGTGLSLGRRGCAAGACLRRRNGSGSIARSDYGITNSGRGGQEALQ